MTGNTYYGGTGGPIDLQELSDPETIREQGTVPFDEEVRTHDNRGHCADGIDGNAVVGVRNDDGELLVLENPDLSVALLPHATVEDGDWADMARRGVEGQTGIGAELEGIEAVRAVNHVLEEADEPHYRTHRVVFRASPTGGEIRECKRSAGAGSDGWRAGWVNDLPEGISSHEGGPRADLELFTG